MSFLQTRRRRLAGGERGSGVSQGLIKSPFERMCAAKNTTPGPCRLLESRHSLAEIVERGGGVLVERPRVSPPHREREFMTIPENASCHR